MATINDNPASLSVGELSDDARHQVADIGGSKRWVVRPSVLGDEFTDAEEVKLRGLADEAPLDYDDALTYAKGDQRFVGGKLLVANQDITSPEAFDAAKWDSAGASTVEPSAQAEVTAGTAETDKYVQPDTLKVELDKKAAKIDATGFAAVGSEKAIGLNTTHDTLQKVVDKVEEFEAVSVSSAGNFSATQASDGVDGKHWRNIANAGTGVEFNLTSADYSGGNKLYFETLADTLTLNIVDSVFTYKDDNTQATFTMAAHTTLIMIRETGTAWRIYFYSGEIPEIEGATVHAVEGFDDLATVTPPNLVGRIFGHNGATDATWTEGSLYERNDDNTAWVEVDVADGDIANEKYQAVSWQRVNGAWAEIGAAEIKSTKIDATAGVVAEVLPKSVNDGAVKFFTNVNVDNEATLAPFATQTINGVQDATFYFSNYAAGTQFRADEVAGGWVISVVGASTSKTFPRMHRFDFNATSPTTSWAKVSSADTYVVPQDGRILLELDIEVTHATNTDAYASVAMYHNGAIVEDSIATTWAKSEFQYTGHGMARAELDVQEGDTLEVWTRKNNSNSIVIGASNIADGNALKESLVTVRYVPTTESVLAGSVVPQNLNRSSDFDLSAVTASGSNLTIDGDVSNPVNGGTTIGDARITRIGTEAKISLGLSFDDDDGVTLDFSAALPAGARITSLVSTNDNVSHDPYVNIGLNTVGDTGIYFNRTDTIDADTVWRVTMWVEGFDDLEEKTIGAEGSVPVDNTGVTDGDALVWNAANGQYEPKAGSSGLRGDPVADNAALTALAAKDYELRKVLADGKEYVFELGAGAGDLADDLATGYWKETAGNAIPKSTFTNTGDSLVVDGFGEVVALKNNLAASSDPTVNDDGAAGFFVSSTWINQVDDKQFTLVDATAGAAVWKEVTSGSDVLLEDLEEQTIEIGTTFTTSSSSFVDVTNAEITLANTGEFELSYASGCGTSTVQSVMYFRLTAGGVEIPNSYQADKSMEANTIDGFVSNTLRYSGTAGDVIKLQVKTDSGTLHLRAADGAYGRTYLRAVQVASKTVTMIDNGTEVNDQATSGYMDIGNMRIQWGVITTTASETTINLPAPFANTSYSVSVSAGVDTNNRNHVAGYNDAGKTTTSFSARLSRTDTFTYRSDELSWQAIGLKP